MYLRTIQRRNRDGSVVLPAAGAQRTPPGVGQLGREGVHSFSREDQLDRDALARLVRWISRFLSPEQALEATAAADLRFVGSRRSQGRLVD